jgi:ribonucleoside-diphosphate reductase alpha subunit
MSSNNNNSKMKVDYVIKRNGTKQEISFDKILKRVKKLSENLNVNSTRVTTEICSQIYPNVPTYQLDELGAQICASLATEHPDYAILAGNITASNMQKNTCPSFTETMTKLYENKDMHGNKVNLISDDTYKVICDHGPKLNTVIKYKRDFNLGFFSLKTLEKSYLFKIKGKIVERPQDMFLRVSIGIHGDDIKSVIETYNLMSEKYFTHATPTLYNAGTKRPQLSSCFLLAMKDDSIEGIFSTLKDCALISKWAGGIGLHLHNIRAKNSMIRGTNGISNGIVPMLRVFNNMARYVDQGGGKRNGSVAMYLEPWHPDVFDFLRLRKNHGSEEERARDLFYALWVPNLFMERVQEDGDWTLMCPDECPGLSDCYGDKFKELYTKYESEGKGEKIKATELWFDILESQIETGTPYLLYKDACNEKSNQKNVGTIKSSNLCTEIIEYSDKNESAVCNLASIGLSRYIKEPEIKDIKEVQVYSKDDCEYCQLSKHLLKQHNIEYVEKLMNNKSEREKYYMDVNDEIDDDDDHIFSMPQIYINGERIGGYTELQGYLRPQFDYDKLYRVAKVATRNLNKVIDINFYPIPETKRSNFRHRPIGLGVQGLADVFAMMKLPFDSEEAKQVNRNIFEMIYFAALESSMEISKKRETLMKEYKELLVNKIPEDDSRFRELERELNPLEEELNRDTMLGSYSTYIGSPVSQGILQFDMWGVTESEHMKSRWTKLRKDISKYGVRNSLLVAPMPTASTSQILGNNECFEPFTSNIYIRRTLAGEFIVMNKYLIRDLINIGVWNNDIKDQIIANNGSIKDIKEIPQTFKNIYKNVWELSNKTLIDMAADRGAFIDQSQSLNLFMAEPDFNKLSSMHFYSWSKGLKTGIYYLRTKAVAQAQKFTIDPSKMRKTSNSSYDNAVNNDICESCSG